MTTGWDWEAFADAVNDQTNSGDDAPVLLLDHVGQPLQEGQIDLVFGVPGSQTVHTVALDPSDYGDLQKAIARMGQV